jgi:UDP-N-acetylglucosamine 4,6-dehydratase
MKHDFFNGQEILVTGGTGSLGKTLIRHLLNSYKIKGIRVYSRDEFKQWEMTNIFKKDFPEANISYLLGDVRDAQRLSRALQGVDIVVNTAAMKQVPACEYNPIEAIRTNIHGVENVINCSIDTGVKKVLHISTDKAVYPINLYGATKTVAEKLFLHANVYSPGRTIFSCCRYGNVLSSRGSIIPLIQEQVKTGVVTLTHPDMTRFFIHLPDVADFILSKLRIMKGEEIFVPKMPTIKIKDLIETLAPECRQEITGIRQGEKLHETLITAEESEYVHIHDYDFTIGKHQTGNEKWTYSSDENPWQLKSSRVISDFVFSNISHIGGQ